MKKKVLSVTRKSQRGGAIYETLVSASLNDNYDVTEYKLDAKKPKIIPYTKLRYRYQVRNISNKEQFDISIFNRAAVYAGIHNYPFKNKVLIMHHYDEFENGNRLTQKYLHDQIIQCVKNLDRLVVVADYWKDYFGQYLDKEKIRVIHNAFDIEEINEHIGYFDHIAFKKENGIPLDKIIVYASNALEVKGYKEVIKKLNPDKYFVVTSGGSDKIRGICACLRYQILLLSYHDLQRVGIESHTNHCFVERKSSVVALQGLAIYYEVQVRSSSMKGKIIYN
jgi:hypothetical protein